MSPTVLDQLFIRGIDPDAVGRLGFNRNKDERFRPYASCLFDAVAVPGGLHAVAVCHHALPETTRAGVACAL
jgi:hypothetical protein